MVTRGGSDEGIELAATIRSKEYVMVAIVRLKKNPAAVACSKDMTTTASILARLDGGGGRLNQ
jgi:hypothetical protein